MRLPCRLRGFSCLWIPLCSFWVLLQLSNAQDGNNIQQQQPENAQAASSSCIDLELTDQHICSISGRTRVPTEMRAWFLPFTSMRYKDSPVPPTSISTAEDFNKLMNYTIVEGLSSWSNANVNCSLSESRFRWYKAYACLEAFKYAAKECSPLLPLRPPPLCPKELQEFALTLQLSIASPSNKCPANSVALGNSFVATLAESINASDPPTNCTSGSKIEGNQFCGYPNDYEGCRHGCDGGTISASDGPMSARCITIVSARKQPTDTLLPTAVSTKYSSEGSSASRFFSTRNIVFVILGGITLLLLAACSIFFCMGCKKNMSSRDKMEQDYNSDGIDKKSPVNDSTIAGSGLNATHRHSRRTFISERSTPLRVSMPPSLIPQKPRRVILSYTPMQKDELELHVGETVAIWEEYEDSYAFGETSDGSQGVFPIMCLADAVEGGNQPGRPNRDSAGHEVRGTVINPSLGRYTMFSVKSDATALSR